MGCNVSYSVHVLSKGSTEMKKYPTESHDMDDHDFAYAYFCSLYKKYPGNQWYLMKKVDGKQIVISYSI